MRNRGRPESENHSREAGRVSGRGAGQRERTRAGPRQSRPNGHGEGIAVLRRQQAPPENHERWLVSYADFITLLFAFFVVMFASSQTDKGRAKQVSEAVTKALQDGHSVNVPPAVARILGGTVDEKGNGNAMMKGPGGSQRTPKEGQPD